MKKITFPSLLLVPPQGSRIKAMRVRFWMVALVVALATVGVSGFFVPVDRLILTDKEQEQKNALMEQNSRLHQNIGATLKVLSGLKEQTEKLRDKKELASEMIGLPPPPPPPPARSSQKSVTSTVAGTTELLHRLKDYENLVVSIAAAVDSGRQNMFDTVPVGYPVDLDGAIRSKPFGIARDPFTGKQKPHYGTDFAAQIGTPVYATASGTVTLVENDPVWGRRIVITHGRDLRTVYAHLGTVKAVQGRSVKRGDEIGTVGLSGLTTGPHVHYELWRGKEQLNPEDYFFPQELVALNQ